MQKGMMMPFFTEIPIQKRLELFKKAGFDNLMFTTDREHEKFLGKLEDVVSMCKTLGIGIKVAHAGYKEPDVTSFWADNDMGKQYEQRYLKDIEFAHQNNINIVVFHLNAGTDYNLSQIGLSRLRNMVALAEKLKVKIAIENLYRREELGFIFDHIQSDYLGMCYDCGHENFLTPNQNFLQLFGHKLFCVHLHDNDGINDLHQIPFTNSVNWEKVASGLAKANQVSLDGEIKIKRPTDVALENLEEYYFDVLCQSYQSLCKLEKLVLKHQ